MMVSAAQLTAAAAIWISISVPPSQARFPDGPNQQCADDAGPPWMDDGPTPYYKGFAAKPKLPGGQCPSPLRAACEAKGVLSAFHNGPISCGGKGWFCTIVDQPGHRMPGAGPGIRFPDNNFHFCAADDDAHIGHCHGSDAEDTYGWWVRDHWHRNYAGKLRCCCDWEGGTTGYVDRCDYRKHVTPQVLKNCRDANEEHNVDWGPGCGRPRTSPPDDQCWEMEGFGPGPLEDGGNGDIDNDTSEPTEEDGDGGNECNPNLTDKLICKSGKTGKSWSICKNIRERKYCPAGMALCGNGRCFKSTRFCGGSGVKIPKRPCDDEDEGVEEEEGGGELDDECSKMSCDKGGALCLRRKCQGMDNCALKRDEDDTLACAARNSVSSEELCQALNRAKNRWTRGWCRTEPECRIKRRGKKLVCISR